jgi:hypothetical protein
MLKGTIMSRQTWEAWKGINEYGEWGERPAEREPEDTIPNTSATITDGQPVGDEEARAQTAAWAATLPEKRAAMVDEGRIPTDRELQMGRSATGQAIRIM